jgi:hypothetical protein
MGDQDVETLLPCPVCGGRKSLLREGDGGRYRMMPCRWCKGVGCISYRVLKKYIRWRRILKANNKRCGYSGV